MIESEIRTMLVTEVKRIDSKKSLIYIDYEPAFSLYKSEIRRYHLEPECELDDEAYYELFSILTKRCRERTAYILGKSDKSEHDLRQKLTQGYYPEVIIEKIINEFIMMGYISDRRYAENYVKYNISSKSRNRIYTTLITKGIKKDIIREVLEEYEQENDELQRRQDKLIEKEFYKKKYDFADEDRNRLGKIISSLLRKGFQYDDIMRVYSGLKTGR